MQQAARLLGAAEAIRHAASAPVPPWERTDSEQQLSGLRAALGDSAFESAREAGPALPVEAIIAEALEEAQAA